VALRADLVLASDGIRCDRRRLEIETQQGKVAAAPLSSRTCRVIGRFSWLIATMDILIVYLLGMAIASLVGAAVGQLRGRILAGFLFGGLLGPVGWLLVAIGPNYSKDVRKCPFCSEFVKSAANICKHCGKSLSVSTAFTRESVRLSDDDFEEWRRQQSARPNHPTA
jgi:hypothetical protein